MTRAALIECIGRAFGSFVNDLSIGLADPSFTGAEIKVSIRSLREEALCYWRGLAGHGDRVDLIDCGLPNIESDYEGVIEGDMPEDDLLPLLLEVGKPWRAKVVDKDFLSLYISKPNPRGKQ